MIFLLSSILEHAMHVYPSLYYRCTAEIKKKHISFMGMQTTEQRRKHNQHLSASLKYLLLYILEHCSYSPRILPVNSNQQFCSFTRSSFLLLAGYVQSYHLSGCSRDRQPALVINFHTQLLGIHNQMSSVGRWQRSQEDFLQRGRTGRMCYHMKHKQWYYSSRREVGLMLSKKPQVQTAGQKS